ncbi:MAG: hypothetical protein KJ574_01490 [Nanoarchaeota archaeon]|nr:hypothetical protein [Nanoarchaeota archaeon]
MPEQKSKTELKKDFVSFMLNKAQKEDKPAQPDKCGNVDPAQIEKITKGITKNLQQRK